VSEINKQVSTTMQATIVVTADTKWILSVTEPAIPAGYDRAAELDLDLGIAGKWWAFIKVS